MRRAERLRWRAAFRHLEETASFCEGSAREVAERLEMPGGGTSCTRKVSCRLGTSATPGLLSLLCLQRSPRSPPAPVCPTPSRSPSAGPAGRRERLGRPEAMRGERQALCWLVISGEAAAGSVGERGWSLPRSVPLLRSVCRPGVRKQPPAGRPASRLPGEMRRAGGTAGGAERRGRSWRGDGSERRELNLELAWELYLPSLAFGIVSS